jgi:hypothetical protein
MKEFFAFLWNPNLYCHLYSSLPLYPTLKHMNSFRANFLYGPFNIILCVPGCFKEYSKLICIHDISCACHIHGPSHPRLCNYLNIRWGQQPWSCSFHNFSSPVTSGLPVISVPCLIHLQFAFSWCDRTSFIIIAARLIASLNRSCQWLILIGVRPSGS